MGDECPPPAASSPAPTRGCRGSCCRSDCRSPAGRVLGCWSESRGRPCRVRTPVRGWLYTWRRGTLSRGNWFIVRTSLSYRCKCSVFIEKCRNFDWKVSGLTLTQLGRHCWSGDISGGCGRSSSWGWRWDCRGRPWGSQWWCPCRCPSLGPSGAKFPEGEQKIVYRSELWISRNWSVDQCPSKSRYIYLLRAPVISDKNLLRLFTQLYLLYW